jgi:hypothetical protein
LFRFITDIYDLIKKYEITSKMYFVIATQFHTNNG